MVDRGGPLRVKAGGPPTREQAKREEGRGEDQAKQASAAVAQSVERVLGKDEVLGSNPSGSFWASGPRTRVVRALSPAVGPRPLGCSPRADHVTCGASERAGSRTLLIDSRDAVRR